MPLWWNRPLLNCSTVVTRWNKIWNKTYAWTFWYTGWKPWQPLFWDAGNTLEALGEVTGTWKHVGNNCRWRQNWIGAEWGGMRAWSGVLEAILVLLDLRIVNLLAGKGFKGARHNTSLGLVDNWGNVRWLCLALPHTTSCCYMCKTWCVQHNVWLHLVFHIPYFCYMPHHWNVIKKWCKMISILCISQYLVLFCILTCHIVLATCPPLKYAQKMVQNDIHIVNNGNFGFVWHFHMPCQGNMPMPSSIKLPQRWTWTLQYTTTTTCFNKESGYHPHSNCSYNDVN